MAAMLRDFVVVVVVVGRMRPRSTLLAMLTMTTELHSFLFICVHVVVFL